MPPSPSLDTHNCADTSIEELPPTPDQDGPHDVPDNEVIEKTLPASPPGDHVAEASA